jgi:arylsulfatase B
MKTKKNLLFLSLLTLVLGLSGCFLTDTAHAAKEKPNIVIVITDDQGYGDLGCTGNPVIKTPHTDKLANESVWLTDYHVAPTCSPTRAALMSGHWTNRTGYGIPLWGVRCCGRMRGPSGSFLRKTDTRRDVW